MEESSANGGARRWWRKRWLRWAMLLCGVVLIAGIAALQYVATHAEPLLRERIIRRVSERFQSPVELDRVEVSVMKGLQVTGEGLRVQSIAGPGVTSLRPGEPPMLTIRQFRYRTSFLAVLRSPRHIGLVDIDGAEIHIPPADQRSPLLNSNAQSRPAPGVPISITHVRCSDVKLFIEIIKPGGAPLEFDIYHADLTGIDPDRAFQYDATLRNAKPTGLIHAVGSFGPWRSNNPRASAIEGNYSFDHAELNSIKGIGGTLSSTGHFGGSLGEVAIDGTTDTPDFSLDTGNHPVPLHTQFHAIVDGTTGDTTLDPVRARLLHSSFTARGVVKVVHSKGHDISLDVDMPDARIEDMLQLAVKTDPPLMRGALTMQTRLHIPPGPVRVAQKLELTGKFNISHVSFSNRKVQDKVDDLSLRAQGRPEDAREAGHDRKADIASQMNADFKLGHAMTTIENLHYQIPGALVLMNGVYSLDGQVFEFKGHVRTDATASQMTTGWKSILLMTVDRFLKKDGAGMELPIQISGTKSEPHIGLAMQGANDSAAQMEQELKAKAKAAKDEARSKKAAARTAKRAANQE